MKNKAILKAIDSQFIQVCRGRDKDKVYSSYISFSGVKHQQVEENQFYIFTTTVHLQQSYLMRKELSYINI